MGGLSLVSLDIIPHKRSPPRDTRSCSSGCKRNGSPSGQRAAAAAAGSLKSGGRKGSIRKRYCLLPKLVKNIQPDYCFIFRLNDWGLGGGGGAGGEGISTGNDIRLGSHPMGEGGRIADVMERHWEREGEVPFQGTKLMGFDDVSLQFSALAHDTDVETTTGTLSRKTNAPSQDYSSTYCTSRAKNQIVNSLE